MRRESSSPPPSACVCARRIELRLVRGDVLGGPGSFALVVPLKKNLEVNVFGPRPMVPLPCPHPPGSIVA